MKTLSTLTLIAACSLGLCAASHTAEPNTLTDVEKAAGWKLLFDGQTTAGWRSFKTAITTTNGWIVEDGWLKKPAKVKAGDIFTKDAYTDFELTWEWRIPARANNGVKYFVTEARNQILGHEYQMIDDSTQKNPKSMTASLYDLIPRKDHAPVKLAPEFNSSRLIVQGDHVEHWLNGEKVLEYECGSPEVVTAVAKSKFKAVKDFGKKVTGYIQLTDHNDEASFRNIKIRELPPK